MFKGDGNVMKYESSCAFRAARISGVFLGLIAGLVLSSGRLRAQTSAPAAPTSLDYTRSRSFPDLWAPYSSPMVPELKMSNSQRLHSLIQDGKLRLSLDDALALVLENNLDIEVSRYSLAYAQTDVLRTRSGNTFRGINPGLFGGVTAFGGGGGGGGGGGTGNAGGITGGGNAINVGTASCCDPFAGVNFGWDRSTSPLNNLTVSGISRVTTQRTNVQVFYGQGFLTGTNYLVALSGFRQSSTSFNNLFNPEVPTGLTLGFNQRLLNGFGYRANAKFIRIAKNDLKLADSTFRQQVMTTVAQMLNLYSDLLYYKENVRVAQQAVVYAEKLLEDNKRQVEIGTLAPIEVVRAESELATDQQSMIVAQTNYLEQQESIKTAISKHVDPELAAVQIEPTDALPEPSPNDVLPLDEAIRVAEAKRPELEQQQINIRNQEITIQAARNALLPTLDLFGTYAPTGLSGNKFICPAGSSLVSASGLCQPGGITPSLVPGGFSQSLSQLFHGRFADYSFGITLSIPIRNRSGQADMATALLQDRQLRTQMQQTKNQIDQAVRNAVIAVTQAKAQVNATHKAAILAKETLDAEQKKFQLGESTVFNVILTERDYVAAQGNEAQAHSTYSKALTGFWQAAGTVLDRYNIGLAEAKTGQVTRVPNIPGSPAAANP